MLEQADLAERADDQIAELSGGNQQRVNIAIGLLPRPAMLLLDEPSTGLDPRQRSRLWEFVIGARRRRHDGDLLDPPHPGGRALRRPAAGAGRRRGAVQRHLAPVPHRRRRRPAARRATSKRRSSPSCASRGPLMRWLLLKDLQILRRSPLVTALLVIYPVVIAVLVGFALSRGPDKPRVAFLNEVPKGQRSTSAAASSTRTRPATSSARRSSASASHPRRRRGRRSPTARCWRR